MHVTNMFLSYIYNQDILSEQEKAGEIVFSRREDLLARTLDKQEHPGRVRAVSQYVTITDYFGHASQGKSDEGIDGGEAAISGLIQEIQGKMNEKLMQMQEQHAKAQGESQAQIQEMQEIILILLDKLKRDDLDLPTPKFGHNVPQAPEVYSSDESSAIVKSTPIDLPVEVKIRKPNV